MRMGCYDAREALGDPFPLAKRGVRQPKNLALARMAFAVTACLRGRNASSLPEPTDEDARRARAAMMEQLHSMAQDTAEAYKRMARHEDEAVAAALEVAAEPSDARIRFRAPASARLEGRRQEDIALKLPREKVQHRHYSRIRALEFAAEGANLLPAKTRRVQPKKCGRKPSHVTRMLNPARHDRHRQRRNEGKHAQKDALRFVGVLAPRLLPPERSTRRWTSSRRAM